jgi:predicted nucleotidyltransferase
MEIIEQNTNQLIELCVNHKVGQLYLFGSVLTNQFNASSDIDFLVQFNPIDLLEYFDNYMDFKEQLEALFGRSVDLVENQAVKNPIFRRVIDREKQLIYERKSA